MSVENQSESLPPSLSRLQTQDKYLNGSEETYTKAQGSPGPAGVEWSLEWSGPDPSEYI